ncbi:MAG: bifunctional demethylmenaquinone methyltransferase/2-methoxy-6-polyprenyl-1,4-benzoquinol methylase UbiE [Polyangiaceae bacterium]|nr:bifunctional demethylmenaquinone methyltransferase/2-methoxy-6-polyprenyl-1,4-benzoquinol methylase UbiE [Polyangiaceae bacterium]
MSSSPTPTALARRDGSGAMFDGIAPRYDLLNRLLSFGLDQRWRKMAIHRLRLKPQAEVLDLATGTGDVAIAAALAEPTARVVGVDPSEEMMVVGRRKISASGLSARVSLLLGDAQALTFGEASFDGISMAFGIRNVPDRLRALAEMKRVLKPGGRVVILELSEPPNGVMGALAKFHVHVLVPWLGALVSGAHEYRYLQRSIAAFPPASEFAKLIEAAGLVVEEVRPLTFGVAHLYVAENRAPR